MGASSQLLAALADTAGFPAALTIPALIAGSLALIAFLESRAKTAPPTVQLPEPADAATSSKAAAFHQEVLDRCPSITRPYKPVPFLTNCHVETIFAAKFRLSPLITYRRELLRMADGGHVALDWELDSAATPALPADAPILILLPGLTGGSDDSYVMYAVQRARQQGIRAVVFNSRGTANSPVTTPQYYSASFTGDTRAVVAHVRAEHPDCLLLAAGWSLGANILVRYLGEEGDRTPLAAAVSLCNPFDLTISNEHLTRGFNNLYDWNLAKGLSRIHQKHLLLWNAVPPPFQPHVAATCTTIKEFDNALTIHSFGWPSVEKYYAGSSSALSIPQVTIPLLCIQALDDPIAPAEAIPVQALKANPNTVLVTTTTGGHLGWVGGDQGPRGHPWSDQALVEWLASVTQVLRHTPGGPSGPRSSMVSAHHGQGGGAEVVIPQGVAQPQSQPVPAAAAVGAVAVACSVAASTAGSVQASPLGHRAAQQAATGADDHALAHAPPSASAAEQREVLAPALTPVAFEAAAVAAARLPAHSAAGGAGPESKADVGFAHGVTAPLRLTASQPSGDGPLPSSGLLSVGSMPADSTCSDQAQVPLKAEQAADLLPKPTRVTAASAAPVDVPQAVPNGVAATAASSAQSPTANSRRSFSLVSSVLQGLRAVTVGPATPAAAAGSPLHAPHQPAPSAAVTSSEAAPAEGWGWSTTPILAAHDGVTSSVTGGVNGVVTSGGARQSAPDSPVFVERGMGSPLARALATTAALSSHTHLETRQPSASPAGDVGSGEQASAVSAMAPSAGISAQPASTSTSTAGSPRAAGGLWEAALPHTPASSVSPGRAASSSKAQRSPEQERAAVAVQQDAVRFAF